MIIKYYFNPIENGTFTLTYTLGSGTCERKDSITFSVDGPTPQVEDLSICPWSNSITLEGIPAQGTWQSPDCSSCIIEDTFYPSELGNQNEVTLLYTVVDQQTGCSSAEPLTITVLEPDATFSIDSSPCVDNQVAINTSTVVADQMIWIVNNDTSTPPPFEGLHAGLNQVELIAIIENCSDTFSLDFNVAQAPISANFQIDRDTICPGNSILFTPSTTVFLPDSLAGNISYSWDFDRFENDLVNDLLPGQSIEYNNNSSEVINFSPSFIVSNECGSIMHDTTITVLTQPIAEIGIDSTRSGCSPFSLILTNRSTGLPDSCWWDLGDNTMITGCHDSLSHTYFADTSIMNYTIDLRVANECGEALYTDSISVIPPGIQAFYNIDDTDFLVCPNDTIQFEDASTPIPTSWVWNMGDSTIYNEPNPRHAFIVANDTIKVSLQVSTGCGHDIIEHTIITLDAPELDFEVPPYGCIGTPLEGLVNHSPTTLFGYYWDFGNGITDSTNYNPAPVFFEGEQAFTIKLTVEDFPNHCKNSLEKEVYIREIALPDFILDNNTGCEGQMFRGEVIDSQFATEWTWMYNGNIISKDQTFEYTFNTLGIHQISLEASYDGYCADTMSKAIHVNDCKVYIPTAFSPNGDGINDFFTIYTQHNMVQQVNSFRIFDRWGNMVFGRKDFTPTAYRNVDTQGWDGTFKNEPLKPGVFVYIAEILLADGNLKIMTGDVTLIR